MSEKELSGPVASAGNNVMDAFDEAFAAMAKAIRLLDERVEVLEGEREL